MDCSKLVNNTDLRLLNINFRSIMNKRAEFIHLIDSLKPDKLLLYIIIHLDNNHHGNIGTNILQHKETSI